MANRQEEKARRREERLAQEAAAAQAARRKRAVTTLGAALLATVGIALAVLLVTNAGGDGDGEADAASAGELREAAAAAGCRFRQAASQGSEHVEENLKNEGYNTNPPSSGRHNPVAAQDGFYKAGNEPALGNWIHSLEHGRVVFQFKEGASGQVVERLRAIANEELSGSAGYHTLVMQNNTEMPSSVAAVAWTRLVECDELTPQAEDVLRRFRASYTDKAPEFVP